MRILFWTGNFWPVIGGVEVHATRFLKALSKRGFTFLVICTQHDPSLPPVSEFEGIPIYRFPYANALNNPLQTLEIKRAIEKIKHSFAPDLLHRNSVGVGDLFHVMTAGVKPSPILVTLHGKWLPQADKVVSRTLRTSSYVIGCSRAILRTATTLVPEISSRSSVIYNAVEKPDVPVCSLPWDPPVLLCLGRLVRVKGFDLVIQALATIINVHPTVRLLVAGDGPERQALETLVHERNLNHAVKFCGWVHPDSVPSLINTASIVLIPSRFESLPLLALQAAHMNRPVVGTRVGGLPEVIIHGQTGLLIEPHNSESLAWAVSSLLNDPSWAECLGKAAGDRMDREFKWDSHIDRYAETYRNVCQGLPADPAAMNSQPFTA